MPAPAQAAAEGDTTSCRDPRPLSEQEVGGGGRGAEARGPMPEFVKYAEQDSWRVGRFKGSLSGAEMPAEPPSSMSGSKGEGGGGGGRSWPAP